MQACHMYRRFYRRHRSDVGRSGSPNRRPAKRRSDNGTALAYNVSPISVHDGDVAPGLFASSVSILANHQICTSKMHKLSMDINPRGQVGKRSRRALQARRTLVVAVLADAASSQSHTTIFCRQLCTHSRNLGHRPSYKSHGCFSARRWRGSMQPCGMAYAIEVLASWRGALVNLDLDIDIGRAKPHST